MAILYHIVISITTPLRIWDKDGSRSCIVHLHTRLQELGACNPVSCLLHTPGLRIRRDADRAGAFCYTEQQVAREDANIHFWD